MTRFNRPVSANRVVEAVALPLDRLKAASRRQDGVTINDLFLAIVGGALRRYLESKDELPQKSLMALMPIGTRDEGRGRGGANALGGAAVPVHSEIADPLKRLRAVNRDARSARHAVDSLGHGFLKSMLDELPHPAAESIIRHYVYPQLNVTVSNVRGPEAALYVAGARLVHFYPVSIATDYVGLNHTGFSYNGVLWISAVACRNMMPDPAFYADCLRESFEALVAALEALPDPGAARAGADRRAARRGPAGRSAAARTADASPPKSGSRRRTARSASRRRNGSGNSAAG